MTTTNTTEAIPNDTRLADAIKVATKLGGESVKSALAKPQLYVAICRGAADGYLADKDAKSMFDAYLAGRTKIVAGNKIALGDKEDNQNSYAANLSKSMNMHKLGMLNSAGLIDGPALLDQVIERREFLFDGGRKVKATADAMLDVAKAQIKQPTEALSEEQLDEVIARPEKAEKEIIDKLVDQYKKTYKLAAEMGDAMMDCTHIEAARDSIADAIKALDGEVPSMTKGKRDEGADVEFLMAKGMSKQDALAFVRR